MEHIKGDIFLVQKFILLFIAVVFTSMRFSKSLLTYIQYNITYNLHSLTSFPVLEIVKTHYTTLISIDKKFVLTYFYY